MSLHDAMNSRESFQWSQNGTQSLVEALALQGGSRFRIATLILAAINVLSAVILVGSIFFDAWIMNKRNTSKVLKYIQIRDLRETSVDPKTSKYFGFLSAIHAAEVFPLVMSVCIVIQGLIFAFVGLAHPASIIFHGCGRIVQLVFPGRSCNLKHFRSSRLPCQQSGSALSRSSFLGLRLHFDRSAGTNLRCEIAGTYLVAALRLSLSLSSHGQLQIYFPPKANV